MEQFNKAISFILGLIVVVIFLAVVTGKINLKGKSLPFSKAVTPTKSMPTPTVKKTTSPLTQVPRSNTTGKTGSTNNSNYRSYNTGNTPATIPNTGPELLLPVFISSFATGLFLRKKAK